MSITSCCPCLASPRHALPCLAQPSPASVPQSFVLIVPIARCGAAVQRAHIRCPLHDEINFFEHFRQLRSLAISTRRPSTSPGVVGGVPPNWMAPMTASGSPRRVPRRRGSSPPTVAVRLPPSTPGTGHKKLGSSRTARARAYAAGALLSDTQSTALSSGATPGSSPPASSS